MNIPQSGHIKIKRSQITLADYNPRGITASGMRMLRESIERFGVVGGIVVNTDGNTLVGGHQKVMILDDMRGYDPTTGANDYEIDVVSVCVDKKTEKELNITLNNPNVGGYWDYAKLKGIIPDIDYKAAGLTEDDLATIGIDYFEEIEESIGVAAIDSDIFTPQPQPQPQITPSIPQTQTTSIYTKLDNIQPATRSVDASNEDQGDNSPVPTKEGWGNGINHIEPRCDLVEKISVCRKSGRLYLHSFKSGESGLTLKECKVEENIGLFAECAERIMRQLIGTPSLSSWKLICAPKRRHKEWNFAEEVCKEVSRLTGVVYIPDVFRVKSSSRIFPEMELIDKMPKGNIFLYDDILTTGVTMREMENLLHGSNVLRIFGINNR